LIDPRQGKEAVLASGPPSGIGRPNARTSQTRWSKWRSHTQSTTRSKPPIAGVTYSTSAGADSHIKRLRKRFKSTDGEFDMIETLYGVGYRFKENLTPHRPVTA
jgi:hypothetical protein